MTRRLAGLLPVLAVSVPLLAQADAIDMPTCPPGSVSVANPHHGGGWCTPAPCVSDADCPARPPVYGEIGGPRVCRPMGVCVWGDRGDAIGGCDEDGASCTVPSYGGSGTCRVASFCVETSRAGAPPAPAAPSSSWVPAVTGDPWFDVPLAIAFAIVLLTAVSAPFVASPYGRFANEKLGAALDPRLGWMLMELPASVVFLATYFRGPNAYEPFPLFFLFVWCCHYLNRGFLMPLFMRVPKGQKSSFGILVVTVGWCVTSLHGYLNASWVTRFHPEPGWSWFTDPRFLVGVALYYGGLALNLHADHVLRTLRTKEEVERGERHYRIPRGGLFGLVTNASYAAELVFWIGLAIFSWSPAGVFIFAISAANLVPRAIATHRWYREKFPDYPKERRILVPYLW